MSEGQIARATGADEQTVRAWLERREAPSGAQAQRLTELVAFVEEMARNLPGETLAGGGWTARSTSLERREPARRDRRRPLRADDPYALGVSYGTFT